MCFSVFKCPFLSPIVLQCKPYHALCDITLIPTHSPALQPFQVSFHTTRTEVEGYVTYSIKELRRAPIKSFTVSSSPQEADDMARGDLDTLSYLSLSCFFSALLLECLRRQFTLGKWVSTFSPLPPKKKKEVEGVGWEGEGEERGGED